MTRIHRYCAYCGKQIKVSVLKYCSKKCEDKQKACGGVMMVRDTYGFTWTTVFKTGALEKPNRCGGCGTIYWESHEDRTYAIPKSVRI